MGSPKHDLSSFAGRLAWVFDQEGRGSRRKAAERGNFREQRISEWTNPDNRNPSLESLQMISRALPHVRMEWLVSNAGRPYRRDDEAREAVEGIRRLLGQVEQSLGGSSNPPAEPTDDGPPPGDVVGRTRKGGSGGKRGTGNS